MFYFEDTTTTVSTEHDKDEDQLIILDGTARQDYLDEENFAPNKRKEDDTLTLLDRLRKLM